MLWLKVKVGESVYIDNIPLTLLAKDRFGVDIRFEGKVHSVIRGEQLLFPTFAFHTSDKTNGLRLGFDAPLEVRIRRGNA